MDWKDALSALRGAAPEPAPEPAEPEKAAPKAKPESLTVIIDRSHRRGKEATIVFGFKRSDEEVASLASEMKKQLGIGGSSRDGEILLQGDVRDRAAKWLADKGHKVKKG